MRGAFKRRTVEMVLDDGPKREASGRFDSFKEMRIRLNLSKLSIDVEFG
ncbi:MAG TPA: hypothetical protein VGY91_03640 [Chthoniobacterales bacterium]|jgi:hypothetical protein|nr:hypothetical protein [Chthoniobacterales bacterium]